MLKSWDRLPSKIRTDEVRPYYNILKKKQISLIAKRVFDMVVATIMIVILLPLIVIIAIIIKIDSNGKVFFRQERVTQYGKIFRIFKFRTMFDSVDTTNRGVTVAGDVRITRVGKKLRKYRLDEIPQLFNIVLGHMTFVGTRPESKQYVEMYTSEMMATLLLSAGVTSEASIQYKDEDKLLENAEDVNDVYINKIIPEKMKYNLNSLKHFNFWTDILIMIKTVVAVVQ